MTLKTLLSRRQILRSTATASLLAAARAALPNGAFAQAAGLETTKITAGPKLTLTDKEEFKGARAEDANKMLTREYRAPYIVPKTEDL